MLKVPDDKVAAKDGVVNIRRGKTNFIIREHYAEYGKTPVELITELLLRNINTIVN